MRTNFEYIPCKIMDAYLTFGDDGMIYLWRKVLGTLASYRDYDNLPLIEDDHGYLWDEHNIITQLSFVDGKYNEERHCLILLFLADMGFWVYENSDLDVFISMEFLDESYQYSDATNFAKLIGEYLETLER